MVPTASVNGIEVAYDDVGTSEDVLLLIHGHPFNRSMWHPQTEALSRAGWRVIAPDLRGYGETTVVAGKTTRADTDRMHALLAGSQLLWMEGIGHMPNLERATEFNGALERFLGKVAA